MNTLEYTSGVVAIAAYCTIKNERAKNKRLWVHPIVEQRLLRGVFVTLYSQLREHPRNFFNYFWMSTATFDELYVKLEESLIHINAVRLSISVTDRLCVTEIFSKWQHIHGFILYLSIGYFNRKRHCRRSMYSYLDFTQGRMYENTFYRKMGRNFSGI